MVPTIRNPALVSTPSRGFDTRRVGPLAVIRESLAPECRQWLGPAVPDPGRGSARVSRPPSGVNPLLERGEVAWPVAQQRSRVFKRSRPLSHDAVQ